MIEGPIDLAHYFQDIKLNKGNIFKTDLPKNAEKTIVVF